MSEEQHNTYTIQGLKVPKLELQITELRDSVSNLRTLVDAAAEAIIRVDRDVAAILKILAYHQPAKLSSHDEWCAADSHRHLHWDDETDDWRRCEARHY